MTVHINTCICVKVQMMIQNGAKANISDPMVIYVYVLSFCVALHGPNPMIQFVHVLVVYVHATFCLMNKKLV